MKKILGNLEIGTIHALSESNYSEFIKDQKLEPSDELSIVYFGDYESAPKGAISIRHFSFSDTVTSLRHTSALLKKSPTENTTLLSNLCDLYAEVKISLNEREIISCYSDVLSMLQESTLVSVVEQLKDVNHPLASLFKHKVCELLARFDYDYLVNVIVHNVLKEWGEFGSSNSNTEHVGKLPIAKANVLVIPDDCDLSILKQTGFDPLIPSIQVCISMFFSELDEPPIIGLDPNLLKRLGGIGVELNNHDQNLKCA